MARKVKCPVCGSFNDKENTVFHNSKYHCKICFDNKQNEAKDYKELIAYICELYGIDTPTGWMLKQIKDFKEQFNYTYKGIKTTLHYFFEIQEGNDVSNSVGIGIVPFVYEEAKRFYIDKKAVKDSVIGVDINDMQLNKRTITIKRNTFEDNKYKSVALINIEKL
jgi:hypothetical protein